MRFIEEGPICLRTGVNRRPTPPPGFPASQSNAPEGINPDGQQAVLRVLAPNKAIGRRAAADNFPADYLQEALRGIWGYYRASGAVPAADPPNELPKPCLEVWPMSDPQCHATSHNTQFSPIPPLPYPKPGLV